MNTVTDQQLREAERLSNVIRPILHGHGPEVQGAVLADLLSLFIAGHHPALREEQLLLHIKVVRELIPVSEEEVFARHGGRPEGWEPQ